MKDRCLDFQECLILSVYGEVSHQDPAFLRHVATCEECRRKREELRKLLAKVKDGWHQGCLPSERSREVMVRILRGLNEGREPKAPFLGLRAPALAGALMILLTVGVMLWAPWRPHEVGPGWGDLDQGLIAEKLELLEEMEVLEEMDLLQQLVKLVDKEGSVM